MASVTPTGSTASLIRTKRRKPPSVTKSTPIPPQRSSESQTRQEQQRAQELSEDESEEESEDSGEETETEPESVAPPPQVMMTMIMMMMMIIMMMVVVVVGQPLFWTKAMEMVTMMLMQMKMMIMIMMTLMVMVMIIIIMTMVMMMMTLIILVIMMMTMIDVLFQAKHSAAQVPTVAVMSEATGPPRYPPVRFRSSVHPAPSLPPLNNKQTSLVGGRVEVNVVLFFLVTDSSVNKFISKRAELRKKIFVILLQKTNPAWHFHQNDRKLTSVDGKVNFGVKFISYSFAFVSSSPSYIALTITNIFMFIVPSFKSAFPLLCYANHQLISGENSVFIH